MLSQVRLIRRRGDLIYDVEDFDLTLAILSLAHRGLAKCASIVESGCFQ